MIVLRGCAIQGLTIFETIDAGFGAPDADAGLAVCIDNPDAVGDPSACTPGCKGLLREHAYMICSVDASWTAAQSNCQAHGMNLMRVDDAAKNEWVHAVALSASPGIDRNWLGGSDLGATDDWRWSERGAMSHVRGRRDQMRVIRSEVSRSPRQFTPLKMQGRMHTCCVN